MTCDFTEGFSEAFQRHAKNVGGKIKQKKRLLLKAGC